MAGSSAATILITGADVKDGSLTGVDVKNGSIASADVKDAGLGVADLSPAASLFGGSDPVLPVRPHEPDDSYG